MKKYLFLTGLTIFTIFISLYLQLSPRILKGIAPPQTFSQPSPTASPVKSGWKTYTNTVHKYTLNYPSDWEINSQNASRTLADLGGGCCENASLIISHDGVIWKLTVGIVYTGGGGFNDIFYKSCNASGQDVCRWNYEGPFQLPGNKLRKLTKATFVNTSTVRTLAVQVSDFENENKSPYFTLGLYPGQTLENQLASLTYEGKNLDKYMDTLDEITASLTFN